MIRRLICILRHHDHEDWNLRHEWVFSGRVVFMEVCRSCGVQITEGNSDGWMIPQWVARDLLKNTMATWEMVIGDILIGPGK